MCIARITPSRKFECPFCEYVTCKACVQQYITSITNEPNCMNCHRRFDREILTSKISQSFVKRELKNHRENVLFERESSMLPATQPYLEQEMTRRANCELLRQLTLRKSQLRTELFQVSRTCERVSRQLIPPLNNERRQFMHRCAQPSCRGFLSSSWKCTVCSLYTCSECNAPRGEAREDDHVCKEEDKATMLLIKRDARKCPGCAEPICKIDGCDQMWCTVCHTAFSWRTGQKVTGVIHNPHFYQFQRQTHNQLLREPGDIPCGGLPTHRELVQAISRDGRAILGAHDAEFLMSCHRLIVHIEDVERHRYNTEALPNESANVDLRILYMLNELTVDTFKQKLQQREKSAQKRREIGLVLQMFVHTMSDLFRQLVLTRHFSERIMDMHALVDYFNRSMSNVSVNFACVTPVIDKKRMRLSSSR